MPHLTRLRFAELMEVLIMVMKIVSKETPSKSSAKPATAKPGRKPLPVRKVLGKSLGLSIGETWAKLLSDNSRGAAHRTDSQLSAFMHAEYPARKSAVMDNVSKPRSMYNAGKLAGMEHKPAKPSVPVEPPKAPKKK